MISAFDIGKLRDLLRDFHEITKIRITVFDENMTELVSSAQKYTILCLSRCQSTTYEVSRSFCAICKILFTLHSHPWPPEISG